MVGGDGISTSTKTSRQSTRKSASNTPTHVNDTEKEITIANQQLVSTISTLASRVECVLCNAEADSAIRLVRCKKCGNHFHAHCASLPLPPKDGNLFCCHLCYATFSKQQQSKHFVFRNGDYPRLATQIQSVLQEKSDRLQVHRRLSSLQYVSTGIRNIGHGRGKGRGRGRGRGTGTKRELQTDRKDGFNHCHPPLSFKDGGHVEQMPGSTPRSASSMPYPRQNPMGELNSIDNTPHREDNDRNLLSSPRTVSPASRRPVRGFNTEQDRHFQSAPPNIPASSTLQVSRPACSEYASTSAREQPSAETGRSHHGQYPITGPRQEPQEDLRALQSPSGLNSGTIFFGGRSSGQIPPVPVGTDQRIPSGMQPPHQQTQDNGVPLRRVFEHPYRGTRVGLVAPPAPYTDSQCAVLAPGTTTIHGLPSSTNSYSSQGPFPPQVSSQLPMRRHTPNIPWRNPSAFPSEIYERFSCHSDDANHVFRIDLSPVFADKATKLYQTEIDFFFRCFESPDVSLVVKGMSSELNQYIWAWPFILECCGNDTHFAFDHFQFKQNSETNMPELVYVGELQLSMTSFNSYLEKYLSGVPGKDVVVLKDHVAKKTVSIVTSESIIALNNLVLAKHCTQLYNDLIKGFQWDVFAGGIHCLLQYLPQGSWHEKFSSPRLHFNFPGARGSLDDSGNDTTDTAYQVLVGSLELIIFERFEPQYKASFNHILQRSGYDAGRKTMLLDAHLRALRSAGFAFSTVLLQDGEFVHVNKGRQHFWRVVEKDSDSGSVNAPCVFLSWEWVYQGVSQRGISTECWFAMKNASMCPDGRVFDPRRAIVEAAKCGVAIVRTGQFLRSALASGCPHTSQLLSFTATPAPIDRGVVAQRQAQMVLFLESILPCLDAIVEETYELGLSSIDDSDEFRKVFDDEVIWRRVDAELRYPPVEDTVNYSCGICRREISNLYKQCLGCSVYSRRCRPNMAYPIFRICLRCHSQPDQHQFKPRAIASYYDKVLSSEGHTGFLPSTRRYQSVRSYFKCRCGHHSAARIVVDASRAVVCVTRCSRPAFVSLLLQTWRDCERM
ncbi:unnamed protein product [Peronospora belbahrii]|uniref:Zinc finger PHD-type domain-containing protein n=1 Tax=Peronospora belbahrii TaxID=622444 RepID=A0ABN8DA83_9STRA|nr:unnamed protein product [Peronospora belbahrii]